MFSFIYLFIKFLFNKDVHSIIFSLMSVQFSCSVRVWLCATPWTAARQASLSITNSRSSLKLMSIESMMPSNHLILCHPLLLLPSIFPGIRVFSKESVLRTRWPKYWISASPSALPMNIQDWFPLGWTGWISCSARDSQESSSTLQFISINSSALSFLYNPSLTFICKYFNIVHSDFN